MAVNLATVTDVKSEIKITAKNGCKHSHKIRRMAVSIATKSEEWL